MNHVNWVQQEDNTQYHVLKWRTSHFHEPQGRLSTGAAAQNKILGGAGAPSAMQSRADGIGLGLQDTRQSDYKSGGTGLYGLAENGSKSGLMNDAVSISTGGAQRQQAAVTGVETPLAEVKITDDIKNVAATAQTVPAQDKAVQPGAEEEALKPAEMLSGLGNGEIRGRLKDTAQRLKEVYLKQQKKLNAVLVKSKPKEEKKEKNEKGTRQVSKESMLAMQAENHYLLDSYDKNGQYSMLGGSGK